jgi:hypothetical protein
MCPFLSYRYCANYWDYGLDRRLDGARIEVST